MDREIPLVVDVLWQRYHRKAARRGELAAAYLSHDTHSRTKQTTKQDLMTKPTRTTGSLKGRQLP